MRSGRGSDSMAEQKTLKEALFQTLLEGSVSARHAAALDLREVVEKADRERLFRLLSRESVPWVKHALEQAFASLDPSRRGSVSEVEEFDAPVHIRGGYDDPAAVIGQVLHELLPAVGKLKLAATRSFQTFEESELKIEFDKLDELLEMFERWRQTKMPLKSTEFRLSQLVGEVVQDNFDDDVSVLIEPKTDSLIVRCDRTMLSVILANGIRNAKEAIVAKGSSRRRTDVVTVSFGATDRDWWVAVIDDGLGLADDSSHLFRTSTSTKPGHRGLGLPVALSAATRMGGRLSLDSQPSGGARLLFSMPFDDAPQ